MYVFLLVKLTETVNSLANYLFFYTLSREAPYKTALQSTQTMALLLCHVAMGESVHNN